MGAALLLNSQNRENKMSDELDQGKGTLIYEGLMQGSRFEARNGIPLSPNEIDILIWEAVFNDDDQLKVKYRQIVRSLASSLEIYPASIQGLYEAGGKGLYTGITVPAINIRGITYQVARAIFRAAIKLEVGAFIFEIARSEIGYTKQSPSEFSSCILAAAMREGFSGPVFIQGDHFQVKSSDHKREPERELNSLKELVRESVDAGFFNIDIDASTLVNLKKTTLQEQQESNYLVTAKMTEFIRSIEPEKVTISIGGEIGEIGKGNSSPEELRTFMQGYLCSLSSLSSGTKGISKISVQSGTTHGGVVLPDGSIAKVNLDFGTLERLSKIARKEYGMAGAVQHGASTLPDEAFDIFPKSGTAEVHLATAFQNLVLDSPHFPQELLNEIHHYLLANFTKERKVKDTDEQFLYKIRKKGWGHFKKETWSLPQEIMAEIMTVLEDRFLLLFRKLNVAETVSLIERFVTKDGA
jgi:fructose/tagatose bisphosphate aldolase